VGDLKRTAKRHQVVVKGEDNMEGYFKHFSFTIVALLGTSLLLLFAACSSPGSPTTPGEGNSANFTPTPTQVTPLTLEIRCHDSGAGGFYVLGGGTHGRVCVQTAPGAVLTITVRFCNGAPDPSSELKRTVYADSKGYYEWNWTPQPDCKERPIWKGDVVVKAQLHGHTTSLSASFFAD